MSSVNRNLGMPLQVDNNLRNLKVNLRSDQKNEGRDTESTREDMKKCSITCAGRNWSLKEEIKVDMSDFCKNMLHMPRSLKTSIKLHTKVFY